MTNVTAVIARAGTPNANGVLHTPQSLRRAVVQKCRKMGKSAATIRYFYDSLNYRIGWKMNRAEQIIADRKARGQSRSTPGHSYARTLGAKKKGLLQQVKQADRQRVAISHAKRSAKFATAWGSYTSSGGTLYSLPFTNATSGYISLGNATTYYFDDLTTPDRASFDIDADGFVKLLAAKKYKLPDGSTLDIDRLNSYALDDKDAQPVWRRTASVEFNPYLNASDLLAKFIDYVRSLGLSTKETAKLPVALFINWLILEAAEKDHVPAPDDVTPVPAHPLLVERVSPKCLDCGAEVPRALAERQFLFCDPTHAERYHQKLLAA